MKVLALLLVVAALGGCGHSSTTTPPTAPALRVSWQNNGNPGAVSCTGTVTTDCLAAIKVIDLTPVPAVSYTTTPAATSLQVPNSADSFVVVVVGFDHNGAPLTSPQKIVPIGSN